LGKVYESRKNMPNSQPQGLPTIRTIAMPADTNPAGDIFGGWLMSQMDLAAGSVAALTARGRSATIAVEGMKFHRPVKVGDEVSLYAEIVHIGRTSMRIHVEAWRRQREREITEQVTEAVFTFVALDENGAARPVLPETA
jgi:acyl-CoA thioesterase YciA